MPDTSTILLDKKIISLLKKEAKKFENPIATEIGEKTRSPFQVLISCILSLRTKDTTTGPAAKRLFKLADSPKNLLKLSKKQIEKAIFPVGFYPTKAGYIQKTCKKLIDDYDGQEVAIVAHNGNYRMMENIINGTEIDINLFSNIANGVVLEGFLDVKP